MPVLPSYSEFPALLPLVFMVITLPLISLRTSGIFFKECLLLLLCSTVTQILSVDLVLTRSGQSSSRGLGRVSAGPSGMGITAVFSHSPPLLGQRFLWSLPPLVLLAQI